MKPTIIEAQHSISSVQLLRVFACISYFLFADHAYAAQSVPVAFIDDLPVVAVKLGAAKIDFLLDTGGRIGITVPPPLVTEITEVEFTVGIEMRGDAAGNRFEVKRLRANSVVLGDAQLGPVDGLLHYRWGLNIGGAAPPSVTQKGVIGLQALETKNVLLDLGRRRMQLFDRRLAMRPDVEGWVQIPFEYDQRGIVVAMLYDSLHLKMVLDTAATATMIKSNSAIFSPSGPYFQHRSRDSDFYGTLSLKGAHLGNLALLNARAAIVKMGSVPFDGILGIDFFIKHVVYIDFDKLTIYLRYLGAAPRAKHRVSATEPTVDCATQ